MNHLFRKEILTQPTILASFGIVGIIAIGSLFYYLNAIRLPSTEVPATTSDSSIISATGVVMPSQNPDLAFETSGKVTRIPVQVGQTVRRGELLASLDTASLAATRAQAVASVKAEQAKLDLLKTGARQVDIDAKQTNLDAANQALANDYNNASNVVRDSWGKAYGALHSYADPLYSNPDSAFPALLFQSAQSQDSTNLITARVAIGNEFDTWKSEIATLSDSSSNEDVQTALSKSSAHLEVIRSYTNDVLEALATAIPSTTFTSASIASANTAASTFHDTIGTLITATESQTQRIKNDIIAVRSAQNALDQLTAGATSQDIDAQQARVDAVQAQVAAADTALSKAMIVAPFTGTVSSIQVNVGDIAVSNIPAISLSPASVLEVRGYVSPSDAVRISQGDPAQITLDAYGSSRIFPATVVIIDRAPTTQNGVPAYKITLQFEQHDPSVSIGMNANISIPIKTQ